MRVRQRMVLLICILWLITHDYEAVSQTKSEKDWTFKIYPYVYVPTFNGTFQFKIADQNVHQLEVEVPPEQYLDHLKLALMFGFEVRYKRFSFYSDLFYYDFTSEDSYIKSVSFDIDNPIQILPTKEVGVNLDAGTTFTLESTQFTFLGGYHLIDGKFPVTLLTGLRFIHLYSQLDWRLSVGVSDPSGPSLDPSGSLSEKSTSWNGLLGIRGNLNLISSEKLKLDYHLDAGLGSSTFTWQTILGVSYHFGPLASVNLAYRYIYYDQENDTIIDRLSYSGLAIGAGFSF